MLRQIAQFIRKPPFFAHLTLRLVDQPVIDLVPFSFVNHLSDQLRLCCNDAAASSYLHIASTWQKSIRDKKNKEEECWERKRTRKMISLEVELFSVYVLINREAFFWR